jgi:hypothetical protein
MRVVVVVHHNSIAVVNIVPTLSPGGGVAVAVLKP